MTLAALERAKNMEIQEKPEDEIEADDGEMPSVTNSGTDVSNSKPGKFELTSILREKLAEFPEVLELIERLQRHVEKQRRKLQKLKKKKRRERSKLVDVATQTGEPEEEKPKTLTEEITEAAEQALQKTGFVYEETSGMYYDYNSGYYYNAEYGLYYDGNTGTYLKYNQEKESYEFHSQVALPKPEEAKEPPSHKKKKAKRKVPHPRDDKHAVKRRKEDEDCDDLEEGECSDRSRSTDENRPTSADEESSSDTDPAKQWPPSMRVIVETTNVPNLKQGSLHLITYQGGTLGREGDRSIIVPDINVSKLHARFHFEGGKYYVTDLGSRNGTYLNGTRLSPSKMESEGAVVEHGSRLQVGGTTLLCHVHKGSQTCGHCEPGLIQVKDEGNKVEIASNKMLDHKQQLKQLRKKFGITQGDQGKTMPGGGYTDRAQARRDTVGSQNPHEKTKMASLEESIDSENKGFKLLSKMGWKEGESLGKDNKGRLEPVELVSNPGLSGLGNASANIEVLRSDVNKKKVRMKTQERYDKIPEQVENMFEDT